MQNLGKIIILFLLLHVTLFATIKATLDSNGVYEGELVTYRLTMSGNEIEKPILSTICGNDIVSTGSQTSIEMINGGYARNYTLSYQFMPQKSCEIPAVSVKVDGKLEQSNTISLRVKKASEDKDPEFKLILETPKHELYVGEPFELTLLLKQKRDAQAVDSKFLAPDFKGFWVKSESKPQRSEKDGYIVTRVDYRLAAQRDGNLTITPAQLKIATRHNTRDMWGSFSPSVKWRSYFSNELALVAKSLPNSATIIGDFRISARVDKTEINPNEALNVTVEVLGSGNLEDIKSFKPYVKDVNVFDEKIAIEKDKLTQKLVFVADRGFMIPSFSLAYFNTKTQRVEQIKTEPIAIKVNNATSAQEVKVTRDETAPKVQETSQKVIHESVVDKSYVVGAFMVGLFIGIVLMLFKPSKLFTKEKSVNLKDEKLLLMKLLPYKDDAEVAKIADILEHNIYSSTKQNIDKKELKEIIKRYNIS